jgi:hypothetical protein
MAEPDPAMGRAAPAGREEELPVAQAWAPGPQADPAKAEADPAVGRAAPAGREE